MRLQFLMFVLLGALALSGCVVELEETLEGPTSVEEVTPPPPKGWHDEDRVGPQKGCGFTYYEIEGKLMQVPIPCDWFDPIDDDVIDPPPEHGDDIQDWILPAPVDNSL